MARLLRDTNTLIQHIPRCGGTWVETAIDALKIRRAIWCERQPGWLPNKHALLSQYYRGMDRVGRTAIFVRHPVALYGSIWRWLKKQPARYRQRMGHEWSWHPKREAVRLYSPNFDIWAERMLDKHPLWLTRMCDAYVGPPGGEFIDYIGRTESLCADFRELILEEGYQEAWDKYGSHVEHLSVVNSAHEIPLQMSSEIYNRIESTERSIIDRFYGEETQYKRHYWRSDPAHASKAGVRPCVQEQVTQVGECDG